jgi:hypothetical protein
VDTQQELDRAAPEKTRCPSCGGLNPADADWCGQCLRRFTAPPAPAPAPVSQPVVQEVAPVAESVPPVADAPIVDSAYASYIDDEKAAEMAPAPAIAPPPEAVGTKRGAFTVTETGIMWTCKACETDNPLALQVCSVCGTEFAASMKEKTETKVERDPGTVAMFSLFMPGAGHAYMGMWGQAIARAILSIWVVFTALMGAVQKGGSPIIVAVFGLASVALWLLAAHDSYREAQNDPKAVILKGRAFMYVVLGLLMVLIVLLMGAGLKAN